MGRKSRPNLIMKKVLTLVVAAFTTAVLVICLGSQFSGTLAQQSLPELIIDSQKMPGIAAHIKQAQAQGYPSTLTRLTNKAQIDANRKAACGNFARPIGYECDEYPFASTHEGGNGASVAPVLPKEQRVQGGTMSAFYRKLQEGSKFKVIVR
jgi:hypothetical protein